MIEFQNVSKTYHIRKFEKHVFTDLNFRIEPGESLLSNAATPAEKLSLPSDCPVLVTLSSRDAIAARILSIALPASGGAVRSKIITNSSPP